MAPWTKLSAAMGSGLPDPTTSAAATAPTPLPSVANKPAPGQTGPRGLAPRASFSRVNTGAPPVPDAGASTQKTQPPRGMEFLPAKVAHQEKIMSTTMMRRPDLNSLIKEAMEGTVDKVDIHSEIERQMQHTGESMKTASAATPVEHVPTEYVHKLAHALKHMAKQAAEGPGQGPGALPVSTPSAGGTMPGPGQQGKAHHQPEAPTSASSGVAKDPPTGLKTDMHDKVAQLEAGNRSVVEKLAKDWAGTAKNVGAMGKHYAGKAWDGVNNVTQGNADAMALGAGTSAVVGGGAYAAKKLMGKGEKKDEGEKKASIADLYDAFQAKVDATTAELLSKEAEDAINPARISTGGSPAKQPPPGVSASEESSPSIPQLIASNEAVINATRRDAKAQPKGELKQVLSEPAQTASTDKTLNQTFAHTGEAGAKIASSLVRTAAAQALLSKLAEEACAPKGKKEKNSNMGGLSSPAGQSGFNAASMGGS